MTQPQIQYNREAEVVSIRVSPERSVDSDIQGNVVIDYDAHGNVVNVDIMKINIDEFNKIGKVVAKENIKYGKTA